MKRVAFVCSRIRVEEKLLLQEFARRGVDVDRVDDDALILELDGRPLPWGVAFERSISFGRTLATLEVLEARGVECINRAEVVATCGDKLRTHARLERAGVPAPRSAVAFTVASALEAIERLGYPVVLKPVVGSWGRLVSRLDSRSATEAVLEHREVLGSWQDHVYYIQKYVEKPGRDIRVFVVGDEPICAIYRTSAHWITNTARGATTSDCPVAGAVGEVALAAARAVGGGILAVDLAEDRDGGLVVLEVNHTMEFRNSIAVTGVDIPGRMVDFVLARAGAAPARAAPRSRPAAPENTAEAPS